MSSWRWEERESRKEEKAGGGGTEWDESSERLNRIYRGEGKLEAREGCGSETI
jgi:hypothetical protein